MDKFCKDCIYFKFHIDDSFCYHKEGLMCTYSQIKINGFDSITGYKYKNKIDDRRWKKTEESEKLTKKIGNFRIVEHHSILNKNNDCEYFKNKYFEISEFKKFIEKILRIRKMKERNNG